MHDSPRNLIRRLAIAIATSFVLMGLIFLSRTSVTAKDPAKEPPKPPATSYDQIAPVLIGKQSFAAVLAKDKADKPAVMARQQKLLEERYDLTPQPDGKVTMSRGKPIQAGPTAKLPRA